MDAETKAKKYGIESFATMEECYEAYYDKTEIMISNLCIELPIARLRRLIIKINAAADAMEQVQDEKLT